VAKIWSMPAIVATTDLIASVPRRFALAVKDWYNLTVHEIPYKLTEQQVFMLWHERDTNDRTHAWLRDTVETILTDGATTVGSQQVAE
jgi:DNA-binding transcriptional LysR family regulator